MCVRAFLQLTIIGLLSLQAPNDAKQLADLARLAAAVKPTPEELRWQKIPWLTDLAQAQRVGRAENRPILLWVTGDDPLERC